MFNYCPRCGEHLKWQKCGGRRRQVCPNCHYVLWSKESISVGGIVTKGNQILLVQRAQNPGKGRWTIPGGYVEQEETMEVAIQREIKEETGIITQPQRIVSIAELPSEKSHDVYVTFCLRYASGKVVRQPNEVMAARFVSRGQAKELPLADLTRRLLNIKISDSLQPLRINPREANGFYLYG